MSDLAKHLRAHPDFVNQCIRSIQVIDVNQRTLNLFRAPTKEALFASLDHVFGAEMSAHLAEELLDMWTGRMLSITDISARKKAEAYMKFLGTHDVLTGMYNRAYFDESVQRLATDGYDRTSIVIGDLNGLKAANDEFGHTAGDALIRRAAEVLRRRSRRTTSRRVSAATSSRCSCAARTPGRRSRQSSASAS